MAAGDAELAVGWIGRGGTDVASDHAFCWAEATRDLRLGGVSGVGFRINRGELRWRKFERIGYGGSNCRSTRVWELDRDGDERADSQSGGIPVSIP